MKGAKAAASSSADDASAPAAVLWKAAGDAIAWKASIRNHVARKDRIRAFEAKAEADEAMRRAAEACVRAVDADGRLDTEALGRVTATMREAGEIQSRASKVLARSSRLHRKASAGLKRASVAYKRAVDPKYAAEVRDLAARLNAYALAMAGRAADMRRDARKLVRDAGRAGACMAEWTSAGGDRLAGDADAMSSFGAAMRELARPAGAESNGITEEMKQAEREASEVRKMSAEMAVQSSASAANVRPECGGRGGPDVQRAEAAWRKALAAAKRADAGGR